MRSKITSPYLQRGLCNTDSLKFSGVTHQVFDVYEYWAQTGTIMIFPELSQSNTTDTTARNDYKGLFACYKLAVTLEEPRYQDAVMSKMVRRLRSNVPDRAIFVDLLTPTAIDKWLRKYGSESPIHQLAVVAAARFGTVQQVANFADTSFPQKFRTNSLGYMALTCPSNSPKDFLDNDCIFHKCYVDGYRFPVQNISN
jgi:hypothetical protein